ncbi:exopolysaccharide biosynthesis polyprenyl glycosylphosphotransferase [Nonlabens tegetincola]|uniref:exopolysaccharide biosynthesis polyprenyl glycosylphosphotransferase n=1 Tax=Nonlabens TaxID=363408 RepID=UPI0030C8273E
MPSKNSIHFEISERKILLRVLDVLVVLTALEIVGFYFEFDYFRITAEQWSWTIVLTAYLLFFNTLFELYNLVRASRITSTLNSVITASSLTSLAYLLTPFFTPTLPENRLQILFFYLALTLSMLLWRSIYIKLFASSRFDKKIVLLGNAEDITLVAQNLEEANPYYKVIGYLNTNTKASLKGQFIKLNELTIAQAQELLKSNEATGVVVSGNQIDGITPQVYNWLIELVEYGHEVREYTQVYEEMTERVPVQFIGKDFYRFFPFARNNQNALYRFYHRTMDIVLSCIGLALGILLLPIVLLGNLLGNRGPLLYKQERVGINRTGFYIYKFRSMVTNAEEGGAQFAKKNDVRITKFGRFLRRSRIDEFPQFINILKGDMSIIGPRPERPIFVKELSKKIPFYDTRHVIKPGLTGWAQVKAKYGETDDDHLRKLQYDLFYIKKRSVFLDIRIIVKTLSTVLFFKGQ